MQEKPANWKSLSAAEKRKIRLEEWVRAYGIQFESPEAKAMYQKRATLFKDALELKRIPERVPVAGLGGAS